MTAVRMAFNELRRITSGKLPKLGPDAKSQVTLQYKDGKPVRACQTPVASVGGAPITTIEGLGEPGKLQQAQIAELNHAYATLTDPIRRKQYDQSIRSEAMQSEIMGRYVGGFAFEGAASTARGTAALLHRASNNAIGMRVASAFQAMRSLRSLRLPR